MTIHIFESTGEAYDACQCDENIKTGDTLVIVPEGVVGLAWAWPVAVTERHGHFHTVEDGSSWSDLTDHTGKRVFTAEQITTALYAAADLNRDYWS
jgi:hypothetical protein